MLPATAVGRGQQLAFTQAGEDRKANKDFLAEIRKLEAEKPGAIQKAVLELRDIANKERAQRLSEAIAIDKLGISRANLGLSAQRVAQGNQRLKLDAYNSQLRRLQNDRSWQATLKRLGLQEYGLDLRATDLEAKLRNRGKPKGFTRAQLRDLQQTAGETAREAALGWTDKDGNLHPPEEGGITYQQAMRDMLAEGIPLTVAQKALNAYWKRPGFRMSWETPGQGRPYVKFQNRPKKKR
jgi:hypothetical protein